MPKGFTEQEKLNITEKLITECKLSWQKFGYKKTSIDDLCKNVGISKGAFYLFFDTKELLFLETAKRVQKRLYRVVENILLEHQNRSGMAKALKEIYKEYCQSPFMYETTSPDFLSFFNKLSEEQQKEINNDSYAGAKIMLDKPFLKLKVSEELAISTLSATLFTISLRKKMLYNPLDVFDFMIENLVEAIFE